MAKYKSTTVAGEKSWSWSTYNHKVHDLDARYEGYPLGINLERKWWTSQLDRAQLTHTIYDVGMPDTATGGDVSYGSAFNIDGDSDVEILEVGWQPEAPAQGHLIVADFKHGKLVDTTVFAIAGASNVWQLKGQPGVSPLVVLTGLDEGSFAGPKANAEAETLIYDTATKSLVHTGIFTSSHESTVVDFDHDGDEDIVAVNWGGELNGQIVLLRNDGTTLTAVPIPGTEEAGGSAVEVTDLNGDGKWELIVSEANAFYLPGPAPGRIGIFTLNDDGTLHFETETPLPYFDREVFNGIQLVPGWTEQSHDVEIVAGDIDNDGDQDVLISSAVWSNGTPMSVQQVLVNNDGALTDETDSRMFGALLTQGSSHNFELQDINADGFLDIVVQGSPGMWGQEDADPAIIHGTSLWVNDGTGHFSNAVAYQLGDADWGRYTFNVLDDGQGRWVRFIDYRNGDPLKVEVIETKFALSTGPGLTNPALKGVPGFNEFYYLLHNPDVAAKVNSGKLKDGLTHFLATGQHEGRHGFAAGARVVGSDKADTITLREGNETADGGLGKDKVKGGSGADTFVFSTKLGPANVDTIKDFKPGQGDLIGLDATIFKKIGAALDDGEFHAKNGAHKAHDADDRIVYDSKTGKLYYDVDGDKKGGHDAVLFATLNNKAALDFDHFIIV